MSLPTLSAWGHETEWTFGVTRDRRKGVGIQSSAGTTCSTPTSIEHANIQVKSYEENSRERYICNSGFKRKAGTSSLTKCLHNEDTNVTQWTIPSLKCITTPRFYPQDHKCHVVVLSLGDPSLTHQRPPSTVAPAGVTPEPESPSPSEKGTHSYNSTVATVAAISTSVSVLFGVCVVFLLVCYCKKSRQTSRTPNVPMENMEDIPMTGATNGREEDTQDYQTT
ncbi:interleukin-15 receptor subunit alpha isoform 7-T8 [Molossus nigricans]